MVSLDWRTKLIRVSRAKKIVIQILFDGLICFLSTWIASRVIQGASLNLIEATCVSIGLFVPLALLFSLYRMVVRHVGWRSGLRIGFLMSVYFFIFLAVHFVSPEVVPLSFAFIQPVFLFVILLGSRSLVRFLLIRGGRLQGGKKTKQSQALIYGAGSAGRQLAISLLIDGKTKIVGFIDDDIELQGCFINGMRVFNQSKIHDLIAANHVTDLYLAIPSLPRKTRHDLLTKLSDLPVAVRSLPGLAEIVDGKVHVADLRAVQIEEVLGRDVVPPNVGLLNEDIKGKVVLITGAGGSIGSEIARQAYRQEPRMLILFDQNEFGLYSIERELYGYGLPGAASSNVEAILGSVTDGSKLATICSKFGVETIYHAAAYKHVPLVEQNALMAVWNNIIGTWRLAEVAEMAAVRTFVLISTDKAVRPTNIMGCTKRVAELILQSKQSAKNSKKHTTKFTMVRFGNVLGSSGSVIPVFEEQIKAGGPVTVTHPEIVRYFMTIPEAAQLVIQAGALGNGGDVMVLDMGDPIKIRDLAERMVHLSGLRVKSDKDPDGDIEIAYTGLRAGEKLYEELLIGDNTSSTQHPRICLARENMIVWEELEPRLHELEEAVVTLDSERARRLLMELVPEFAPQCENQDWLIQAPVH